MVCFHWENCHGHSFEGGVEKSSSASSRSYSEQEHAELGALFEELHLFKNRRKRHITFLMLTFCFRGSVSNMVMSGCRGSRGGVVTRLGG